MAERPDGQSTIEDTQTGVLELSLCEKEGC